MRPWSSGNCRILPWPTTFFRVFPTHAMDDGLDCESEENTIDIEGADTEYWFRDPMTILRYLFSHLPFKTQLAYAPIKDYGSDGKRLYCEMWTGNWWWQQQVNAPPA